jgi:adenosylcobinamide-phosphate synthase
VKAQGVYRALQQNEIQTARTELSKIVGRDTASLDEEGITKAAVESVAESTADGIVAPLFYLIIGGPVLALGYKAVNTLDSMVGHKDEKYIDFGWCAARLDDIANYVPARLSGLAIACASWGIGNGFASSFSMMWRDGRKHASPNSGMPEAAMAGALGVKLGGPSTYAGEVIEKPYIGDSVRQLVPPMITEALTISFISSLLMVVLGMAVIWRLQ